MMWSGVFIINFRKYIIVINFFPIDFQACFRELVVAFEHLFTSWKYLLYTLFFIESLNNYHT